MRERLLCGDAASTLTASEMDETERRRRRRGGDMSSDAASRVDKVLSFTALSCLRWQCSFALGAFTHSVVETFFNVTGYF